MCEDTVKEGERKREIEWGEQACENIDDLKRERKSEKDRRESKGIKILMIWKEREKGRKSEESTDDLKRERKSKKECRENKGVRIVMIWKERKKREKGKSGENRGIRILMIWKERENRERVEWAMVWNIYDLKRERKNEKEQRVSDR